MPKVLNLCRFLLLHTSYIYTIILYLIQNNSTKFETLVHSTEAIITQIEYIKNWKFVFLNNCYCESSIRNWCNFNNMLNKDVCYDVTFIKTDNIYHFRVLHTDNLSSDYCWQVHWNWLYLEKHMAAIRYSGSTQLVQRLIYSVRNRKHVYQVSPRRLPCWCWTSIYVIYFIESELSPK